MSNRSITKFSNAPDIESSTLDYATRFKGDVGKWFLELQDQGTEKFVQNIGEGEKLKILDVGGGHGQNVEVVIAMGHSLTIFGSNADAAEMIKPDIVSNKINFETGSFLKLPYGDASFDVVVSYRTLSHMDDWEQYISEMSRVSKSRVIVDFPTQCSFNVMYRLLYFLKKRFEKNTREFNTYSVSTIARYFEKYGFEITGQFHQFFLPMALHRFAKNRTLSAFSEKIFRSVGLTRVFGSPVIASFQRTKFD